MSGPLVYLIDVASYAGNVNWAAVDIGCAGGFSKVTQGTNYVNPFWGSAKVAMEARQDATGFLCGAYMFLDASPGVAQADWFAQHAGKLDGWAIAIDIERGQGNPTLGEAQAAVRRLREHYPHHPITGYIPQWYWTQEWGNAHLGFVDVLWASSYVGGSGPPEHLYSTVPDAMWTPYGGKTPELLQFTSAAVVAGVGGLVDCSAFRGGPRELRNLLTPAAPAPAPHPVPVVEEAYLVPTSPPGVPYKVTRDAGTKPWI